MALAWPVFCFKPRASALDQLFAMALLTAVIALQLLVQTAGFGCTRGYCCGWIEAWGKWVRFFFVLLWAKVLGSGLDPLVGIIMYYYKPRWSGGVHNDRTSKEREKT